MGNMVTDFRPRKVERCFPERERARERDSALASKVVLRLLECQRVNQLRALNELC